MNHELESHELEDEFAHESHEFEDETAFEAEDELIHQSLHEDEMLREDESLPEDELAHEHGEQFLGSIIRMCCTRSARPSRRCCSRSRSPRRNGSPARNRSISRRGWKPVVCCRGVRAGRPPRTESAAPPAPPRVRCVRKMAGARPRRERGADVALVSDTRMLGPDQPALTCSLRGQLAMELEVRGPGHDLHSGNYGGVVHDPLQALCEIVARLHDSRGRVAVPGFYDRIREWSASERAAVARNAPRGAAILRETGVPRTWGERGVNVAERLALRPSLAITGIFGGHAGEGPKAVIPARAVARLEPAEVFRG